FISFLSIKLGEYLCPIFRYNTHVYVSILYRLFIVCYYYGMLKFILFLALPRTFKRSWNSIMNLNSCTLIKFKFLLHVLKTLVDGESFETFEEVVDVCSDILFVYLDSHCVNYDLMMFLKPLTNDYQRGVNRSLWFGLLVAIPSV
ncbi:hypothetical protein L9F63_022319, partial [Diploptera punctata]